MQSSGHEQFLDFIAALGYRPPEKIEPGRWTPFPTSDKRGDTAGRAKLFPDFEGGVVKDWRTDAVHVWQAKRERPFTEVERRAWREKCERARQEAEAERQREVAQTAERAIGIWNKAQRADDAHPYLTRKGVPAHGLRIYRGPLAIAGMKCDGALLVPMRDASGAMRSLQFIAPDGEKRYLAGAHPPACYFAIGNPAEVVCICEGYATGASIHAATGRAVAVAFDAGSLEEVAKAMRAKFPDANLIVCADNDVRDDGTPNTGIEAATKAARAVGGLVAVPELDGAKCDFNDLASARGLEAVRNAVEVAQAPTEGQSAGASARARDGVVDATAIARSDDWPQPQALPELPAVKAFDFALLPDTLRPWAEDIVERVQCPADFVAIPIMTALGAIIGRKLGIRPQEKTDWTECPNQWALLVGRPGVLKSPAMEQALAPIKRLAARAAEAHQQELAEHQAAARVAKLRIEAAEKAARTKLAKDSAADVTGDLRMDEPQAPTLRRYIANDTSAAALGELLRQNPNGVLVFRDELVSLLKGLDREDNAEARGFYLTGWNGNSAYTFDRIGRGLNLHIPAVCLSLLGSAQPGRIAEYLRAAVKGGAGDDGLIQRFGLLVWPDHSSDWRDVDRWPDSEARRQAHGLFERLDALDPSTVGAEQDEHDGTAFLRFDAEALELFREWRDALERKVRGGDLHPALESHLAKYRKLVPTLALVLHVAGNGTGPVGKLPTLQALAWAEYLETHARRAYASVTNAEVVAAKAIIAKLRKGELQRTFGARDVYRSGWAHLSDREQVHDALALLADLDWLVVQPRSTDGRTATVYEANPRGVTP